MLRIRVLWQRYKGNSLPQRDILQRKPLARCHGAHLCNVASSLIATPHFFATPRDPLLPWRVSSQRRPLENCRSVPFRNVRLSRAATVRLFTTPGGFSLPFSRHS